MTTRSGFIDSGVFDHVVGVLIAVGILVGAAIFSPLYFLGRYHGKEAMVREAIERGHYIEQYDPKTGKRIRAWKDSR